jgi:hypothetical protein
VITSAASPLHAAIGTPSRSVTDPNTRPSRGIHKRGMNMTSEKPKAGVAQGEPQASTGFDARDTEHPTGSEQAAENAEKDPPA